MNNEKHNDGDGDRFFAWIAYGALAWGVAVAVAVIVVAVVG